MQHAACQTGTEPVIPSQDAAAAAVFDQIASAARAFIDAARDLDDEHRQRLNRWPEHAARTAGRLRVDWMARHPDLVDIADELVRVTRSPGDCRVSVPVRALDGFTMTAYTGGRGHRLPRPMLAARVSCQDLPSVPWHSCKHGPPPHRILVVVPRAHNDQGIYHRLHSAAENPRNLQA